MKLLWCCEMLGSCSDFDRLTDDQSKMVFSPNMI